VTGAEPEDDRKVVDRPIVAGGAVDDRKHIERRVVLRAQGPDADAGVDPDLELVRQAQAGDAHAFGELVERNRRAVFRAALAALGSPAEADDAAQDAFVMAYRKLHGFRGDASFRTWLLAIAWRKALDRRKSMARWFKLTITAPDTDTDATDWIEQMPGDLRSQEDDLAAAQLQQMVKRLIKTLPRKLRDALLLAGSEEYTYDQISHILGVPIGTVKWRVSEARRLLKQKLAAVGHPHD
jgi:RNA polymerase sigma-70 factor (ECF subfamily)